MARRRGRQSDRIEQAAEAKATLRGDAPDSVKVALRLALKGGRQRRRVCRQCGAVGVHCRIESQPEHWQVLAPTNAPPIVVYWLCTTCYVAAQAREA
jgi:hypothetical protein